MFLDRATLSPQTRLRAPGFPHEMVVYERTTPDQAAERIAGADVVITNKVPLRPDAIRGADRLRLIAVAATGTDVVTWRRAPRPASPSATSATTRSTPCPSTPSR